MSRETPTSRAEYSAMEPRDQGMYDEDDPDAHNDYEDEEPEEYSGPWIVCLYMIDQAYGGPEEGGWYYTYGDPMLTTHLRVFALHEDAQKYVRDLAPILEEMNQGRPSIWSVASEGQFIARICDGWPKPFPEKIPRYS